MSQKESEWRRKLLDLIDDQESGYVDFAELIEETLSNRENEIAEEVEKKISIHNWIIATHDVLPKDWHEGNINALKDVLSILKH